MRIEGWEKRLNDYLAEMNSAPFQWGKCDCLIFASDAVKICTGIDPMSKKNTNDPETIRGMYQTKEEARALIKQYRKSIRDIMDVHFKRKPVTKAQRGDVVYYKQAFGVCAGRGLAFFKNFNSGVEAIKVKDCVLAWGVE